MEHAHQSPYLAQLRVRSEREALTGIDFVYPGNANIQIHHPCKRKVVKCITTGRKSTQPCERKYASGIHNRPLAVKVHDPCKRKFAKTPPVALKIHNTCKRKYAIGMSRPPLTFKIHHPCRRKVAIGNRLARR